MRADRVLATAPTHDHRRAARPTAARRPPSAHEPTGSSIRRQDSASRTIDPRPMAASTWSGSSNGGWCFGSGRTSISATA